MVGLFASAMLVAAAAGGSPAAESSAPDTGVSVPGGARDAAPTVDAPPASAVAGTAASSGGDTPSAVRLLYERHPLVDRVYAVRERRFVGPERVVAAAARARFVLVGERHGNPVHHRLQARLATAAARGRAPGLVFEQLDFPQQPAIDACARDCADFGAELGARVRWSDAGWPDYALYRPIFDAAAALELPVHAGNPGATRIRALGRGGAAEPAEAAWLPLADAPLPSRGRERLVDDLVEGHCGHLAREHAGPIVRAQRLRDAALATTLRRAADAHGAALLFAGNGHVRRDYGVPTLLDSRALLVVGLFEVDGARLRPGDYAALDAFDYVWFTPRVDEPDPCAQFRSSLEKLRPAPPPR